MDINSYKIYLKNEAFRDKSHFQVMYKQSLKSLLLQNFYKEQ